MNSVDDFPKWDAHHHLWEYHPATMEWIPDESIRRDFHLSDWIQTMDAVGIDRSILVQVHQTWDETVWMNDLSIQTDRIAGVVGWIDLLSHSLHEDLHRLPPGHRVVGFRHIMQAEPEEWWNQNKVARGIRTLGDAEFSYDVLLTQSQLLWAERLLPQCGDTRMILDHMAKPMVGQPDRSFWEKSMKKLAEIPNLAVKLSGFTTEAPGFLWKATEIIPYFDFLLTHFGPDRLMIGSDWPVCLMAASYPEQMHVVEDWLATLSKGEKKALWYQSANKWYGF